MAIDQREKAIGTSRILVVIPAHKFTIAFLLISSIIMGFLFRAFAGYSLDSALWYGSAEGVLLIGTPALLAATLATVYAKQRFKYYAFIATLSAILTSVVYFIGFAAGQIIPGIIVANALVVLLWFVGTYVGLNERRKAIFLSFIQPFFSASFLWFWQKFGFIEPTLAIGSLPIAFFKIIVSAAILLTGLMIVFYFLNAPAKRNFGISTIHSLGLFFAQWTTGQKGFEEVLAEMGEPVETNIEGIVFKSKTGRTKALFLAPQVHFGPFGNLGGSEFPALLSHKISAETKAPCFVFHTTVNHDFNPVYSSTNAFIAKKVLQKTQELERNGEKKRDFSQTACFLNQKSGEAKVAAFAFGNNAFLTLTRAPESTEDIELALGLALKNAALKRWDNAIVVDRHNALTDGSMFRTGDREYFEFENAVKKIIPPEKQDKFKMGVAESPLEGFTLDSGIGRAGLKTAVFEIGGKKYCLVLIDGNNVHPAFRANALLALKNHGFAWADVFSTDTHSVNKLGGVHNPVGKNLDSEKLIREIRKSVDKAISSMEECSAAFFGERISISVLGGRKQSELTSTINSVVSIAKVLAPAILVLSVLLIVVLLLSS